jgi:SnoaL-like domain
MMTFDEIALAYVGFCRAGQYEACLALFALDAVSVEAMAPPGRERVAAGLDAIRAKGKWWSESHIVHSAEVFGPYPHDERFAVRFLYEITQKQSGARFQMDEVGLFTISGGKIVREEFFYGRG